MDMRLFAYVLGSLLDGVMSVSDVYESLDLGNAYISRKDKTTVQAAMLEYVYQTMEVSVK